MKGTKNRFFGYDFSPDKRMFHVVVQMEDTPGALNTVLEALRHHLNLIGSVSYSNPDGSATWSGFAEALSKTVTEAKLKKLLASLPVAKASMVESGEDGLLLDSYHMGIQVGDGDDFILLPSKGVSREYDSLSKLLGSGGETVLYDEGYSLGEVNARYFQKLMGEVETRHRIGRLFMLYRTFGWGETETTIHGNGEKFEVKVSDCFECSFSRSTRSACSFMRGHLTGFLSKTFGTQFSGTETKCRMRGDPICQFEMTQAQPRVSGLSRNRGGASR